MKHCSVWVCTNVHIWGTYMIIDEYLFICLVVRSSLAKSCNIGAFGKRDLSNHNVHRFSFDISIAVSVTLT